MTQQHATLAATTIDTLVVAAERLEKAEAKLEQIRQLHHRTERLCCGADRCGDCYEDWPCKTTRILDREP